MQNFSAPISVHFHFHFLFQGNFQHFSQSWLACLNREIHNVHRNHTVSLVLMTLLMTLSDGPFNITSLTRFYGPWNLYEEMLAKSLTPPPPNSFGGPSQRKVGGFGFPFVLLVPHYTDMVSCSVGCYMYAEAQYMSKVVWFAMAPCFK